MWTQFKDMHSGGGQKLEWDSIYIEAPKTEAKAVFYNRFHRNPERVTCTCCGEDYAIYESPSLEEATEFSRTWPSSRPTQTLETYVGRDDVLVIRADEIRPDERDADIPTEGYVWR